MSPSVLKYKYIFRFSLKMFIRNKNCYFNLVEEFLPTQHSSGEEFQKNSLDIRLALLEHFNSHVFLYQ